MLANLAGLWRYRDLVRNLVLRDLRVKYKGSAFGFAWSLAHPLAMAAIYTIAFTWVLRVDVPHYPLFILAGMLPWSWFAQSLALATSAIPDHGTLVRKVAFPRLVLPLGALLAQLVQFSLMYVVVVVAGSILVTGASAALVSLPLLVLLQAIFTAGTALLLSTAYVYFRDTRHLVEVATQIWFWATPIVYAGTMVPASLRPWLALNPMTHFITAYQQVVLHHVPPSVPTVAAIAVVAAASCTIGLWVFTSRERRFAELV